MYEAYVDSSHMTPGHMLLMGFAGMFSRLYADFTTLLDAVSAVPTVDRFKKADLVREASMLQVISMLIYKFLLLIYSIIQFSRFFHKYIV